MDIKENFFRPTAAAPATSPETMWVSDPEFRRNYGMWLADNFDTLVSEYRLHGRFLSLSEL